MDDLLTTRQLESLLKVDRITIYRMLEDGRLRGFKVGGQWRFSRAEVDAWLRGQRSTAEPAEPTEQPPPRPPVSPLPVPCVQAIQSVLRRGARHRRRHHRHGRRAHSPRSPTAAPSATSCAPRKRGRAGCAASWRRAERGACARCHAGLLCGGRPRRGGASSRWPSRGLPVRRPAGDGERPAWVAGLPALAAELGLDTRRAGGGRRRGAQPVGRAVAAGVTRTPAVTWPTRSRRSARERQALLGRLQRIAEITALE